MNSIKEWFDQRKTNLTGDIQEHLDTLRKYAEDCDHITELGTAGLHSTWAFLIAKPKKFITVDIIDPGVRPGVKEALGSAIKLSAEAGIDFTFILDDTTRTDFEIEETDLLFIDTYHVYEHLKKELEMHANKARKYIILHDTTTFAFRGEVQEYKSTVVPENRNYPKGLWPAVTEFLEVNQEWQILEKFENNNGLTILSRK
jgi:hypothetical protein